MITLFSPAKINLFLRIVSKRPDGYHNLSSLFQAISLKDDITMRVQTEKPCDVLTCTEQDLPLDASNLVLRATKLFRDKTGRKTYFAIHLKKRIPMQAGLGGGSSNAATILWGCNELMQTHVPVDTLQEWGGELGSDVPFFFSRGSAYCTGRGEIVYNLPDQPLKSFNLVKPMGGLSTPAVFRALQLPFSCSEEIVKKDFKDCQKRSFSYFNDLEKPSFAIRPELHLLKTKLLAYGFETVLMTGSGSSFFCFGEGKIPADEKLTVFPVHYLHRKASAWYSSGCFH